MRTLIALFLLAVLLSQSGCARPAAPPAERSSERRVVVSAVFPAPVLGVYIDAETRAVTLVWPTSAAEKAGIQVGDILSDIRPAADVQAAGINIAPFPDKEKVRAVLDSVTHEIKPTADPNDKSTGPISSEFGIMVDPVLIRLTRNGEDMEVRVEPIELPILEERPDKQDGWVLF